MKGYLLRGLTTPARRAETTKRAARWGWHLLLALLLGGAALAAAEAPAQLPTEARDALERYLEEEGSPLAGQVTLQLEAAENETLVVRLLPQDPEVADPAVAFLRFEEGHWTVLGVGSAFDAHFYEAYAIPDSLQLYGPTAAGPVEARYLPVEDEICVAWEAVLEEELGRRVERLEASFGDDSSGAEGRACRLTATGTGQDFAAFPLVAADLMGRLEEEGWLEDPRYAADGPTGTVIGLRKERSLAILRVGWELAEGAACPGGPIFECEVAPEDQLHTVSLELARGRIEAEADVDTSGMNADLPPAAQRAAEALAGRLGVEPEEVTVLSADYVEWPDACLGLASPGQMCAQVITPGYQITLEAGGERYVYHSDESGRALLLADALKLEGGWGRRKGCPEPEERSEAQVRLRPFP